MKIKNRISLWILGKIGIDALVYYLTEIGIGVDINFEKKNKITIANVFERLESYNGFLTEV